MKKLLLISLIITIATQICCAVDVSEIFSDQYIHRLEVCGPHSEYKNSQVQTGDRKIPILHLKTTNSVVGIRNGKCAIKSVVHGIELQQDVITLNCQFTEEQRMALAKKMKAAQSDPLEAKRLKATFNNYVKNRPDICTYRNRFEEDDF